MTFSEFLNCDLENSDMIIDYYLDFLKDFSSKNFPFEQGLQLKGSAEKFINTIDKIAYVKKEDVSQYLDEVDSFSNKLKNFRLGKDYSQFMRLLIPTYKTSITRVQSNFENIYSSSIKFINKHNEYKFYRNQDIDLNGFYNTKNANKEKVKELISEAINLINKEHSITADSKKQLIKHLELSLTNLDNNNPDWTKVIGRVKEIVIIISALTTIIGNTSSLFEAKERLEQTSTIIQQTSVNINHTTINKTFLQQNIEQLNNVNNILIGNSDKN
ncbi:MAG TPA: hypothetical protein ENH91_06010 [Leeuwenhoekiella sp.]|nr:hypothetical protein [Leeuwenhoekiella sp.]